MDQRTVCLMQYIHCLAVSEYEQKKRRGGVIIFVSCLALAAACPPPDMSTLVKSWPYRELYGLIRAPLRWHRARHVFVRLGEVRHRERRRQWHASKSPSVWSAGNFSFWGAGRQQANHRNIPYVQSYGPPKKSYGPPKRGSGVVPKVNCRISRGVGGRFEITS